MQVATLNNRRNQLTNQHKEEKKKAGKNKFITSQ